MKRDEVKKLFNKYGNPHSYDGQEHYLEITDRLYDDIVDLFGFCKDCQHINTDYENAYCTDGNHSSPDVIIPDKYGCLYFERYECENCEAIKISISLWEKEKTNKEYGLGDFADRAIKALNNILENCKHENNP